MARRKERKKERKKKNKTMCNYLLRPRLWGQVECALLSENLFIDFQQCAGAERDFDKKTREKNGLVSVVAFYITH